MWTRREAGGEAWELSETKKESLQDGGWMDASYSAREEKDSLALDSFKFGSVVLCLAKISG